MRLNEQQWDRVIRDGFAVPGDLTQPPTIGTDVFEWRFWTAPGWSAQVAFRTLRVPLIPMPACYVGAPVAGLCTAEGIALSPTTRDKVGVAAHELGHWVLGHVRTTDPMRSPILEIEAETVAMLVAYATGKDDLSQHRGYVQHYVQQEMARSLPTTFEHVKRAARAIVLAGRVETPPPTRQVVNLDAASFARRVRFHH